MAVALSIVIYKGSPIDSAMYRHTVLFLEFPDTTTMLFHITGASGLFQSEARPGGNPLKSKKFADKIPVGKIHGQEKDVIESTIQSIGVNNSDLSWNCQNWVGDALKTLSYKGWITNEARSNAIDSMAEIIVDAPDDL